MKAYLPALVLGGLLIMMVLQGVLFASTGLQSSRLQKQLTEMSKKIDDLQNSSNGLADSIIKMKNETSLADITQATTSSSDDPNNLLSATNLAQTLGAETVAPSPTIATSNNKVRLKTAYKNMDVFEAAHSGSRVVGQIVSGLDYPIVAKQSTWYEIKFDTLTNAWVSAEKVYETN